MDYCLYELPQPGGENAAIDLDGASEDSSLLPQFRARDQPTPNRPSSRKVDLLRSVSHVGGMFADATDGEEDDEEYVQPSAKASDFMTLTSMGRLSIIVLPHSVLDSGHRAPKF